MLMFSRFCSWSSYLHNPREDPVFPVLHGAGSSVLVEELLQPAQKVTILRFLNYNNVKYLLGDEPTAPLADPEAHIYNDDNEIQHSLFKDSNCYHQFCGSNPDTKDKMLKYTCSGQLGLELCYFLAQLLGLRAQGLNLVDHKAVRKEKDF